MRRSRPFCRVLHAARDDAGIHPFDVRKRVVDKYREPLTAAMVALGQSLADFLDAPGGAVDLGLLRSHILEPVLTPSRALPVFRRAESWAATKAEAAELHGLLIDGRPAGFDIPTLLLDDFYQRGPGAIALRARAEAMVQMLHDEVTSRCREQPRELRVMFLGASSLLNVGSALTDRNLACHLSVLIVDSDTHALRHARQGLEDHVGIRAGVLRAAPAHLSTHPGRPTRPFDIVYGVTQYDVLSLDAAQVFTRQLAAFLKPGGVLLAGSYLPTLPRATRALATAFVGMEWHYLDEEMWRSLLSGSPFDLAASQIRALQADTVVISARRAVGRSV